PTCGSGSTGPTVSPGRVATLRDPSGASLFSTQRVHDAVELRFELIESSPERGHARLRGAQEVGRARRRGAAHRIDPGATAGRLEGCGIAPQPRLEVIEVRQDDLVFGLGPRAAD